MGRRKWLLVWVPLLVFCIDSFDLFLTPPPPKPSHVLVHNHPYKANLNQTHDANLNQTQNANLNQTHTANLNQTHTANLNQTHTANLNQTLKGNLNRTDEANVDEGGKYEGNTVFINHSSLCSYRGTAVMISLMLPGSFPGINVVSSRHSPGWSKYIVLKLIPIVQVGIIMGVTAGRHIFRALGMTTPSWYHPLSAHKFSAIAIPSLLGNIVINYVQNSEAFEIYLNDELVFCKLQAGRFPGVTEIREIVRSRLAT